jgi:hypothetical protein
MATRNNMPASPRRKSSGGARFDSALLMTLPNVAMSVKGTTIAQSRLAWPS